MGDVSKKVGVDGNQGKARNMEHLQQRMAADAISAVIAGFTVAPAVSMIDKYVPLSESVPDT